MAINTKTAKSLSIELPPDYSASLTRSSNSKASLNCPGVRMARENLSLYNEFLESLKAPAMAAAVAKFAK
jgi:hypothetical protein